MHLIVKTLLLRMITENEPKTLLSEVELNVSSRCHYDISVRFKCRLFFKLKQNK